MTEPVTCSDCVHFHPDPLNPPAGMGRCMHPVRHGYWHAQAKHRCVDHDPEQESETDD